MAVSEDSHFMLGSQRSHCHDRKNQAWLRAGRASGGKANVKYECTDRYQAVILNGHRDHQIRSLQLPKHNHSG